MHLYVYAIADAIVDTLGVYILDTLTAPFPAL